MGACGAVMGGRRRTRKMKGKSRRTRKLRGGNFAGFQAGESTGLGTAGALYPAVENSEVNPKTGAAVPEPILPKGGRRRTQKKSRKGGKHRRGHKSRKMRGGANWVSVAGTGGSYTGDGKAGLINLTQYSTKNPAGGPPQGPDGVYKTS